MKQERVARGHSDSEASAARAGDGRRLKAFLVVALAASLAVAVAIATFALWPRDGAPSLPRAVIVDQLAQTDPNPDFIANAARQLEAAGYHVDYYAPNEVTVDFYRSLPGLGYAFIILRSHASDQTYLFDGQTVDQRASVGVFTNEPYSTATHLDDQRALRLTVDSYTDRNIAEKYFGITPAFIEHSVRGRFNGAIVLLMGCAGLKATDLAQAFISRGVANFIGWDGAVTANHTDAGAEKLLENLFGQHLDLQSAVARTGEQIGPDPAFGGRLLSYP